MDIISNLSHVVEKQSHRHTCHVAALAKGGNHDVLNDL